MEFRDHYPTPLAQVVFRLSVAGPDRSADSFLISSYLAETAIKLIACALQAGLNSVNADHGYRIAYELVRGDGLGAWTSSIERMTSMPFSSHLPAEFSVLLEWFTRRRSRPEDSWCKEAQEHTSLILEDLGVPSSAGKVTVRALAASLVQIRNKTRGHGALGPDFFAKHNVNYIKAVQLFLSECPLFKWNWLHLSSREGRAYPRGVLLAGNSPRYMKDAEVADLAIIADGLYLQTSAAGRLLFLGDLIDSTPECRRFLLPNGGFDVETGMVEYLDYADGKIEKRSLAKFLSPPPPLPASETQGLSSIDVQSSVFGNLPALPKDYVSRPLLEKELSEKLCDQIHEIISLHGNGGMGKTYLALSVAHQLSASGSRFENIIWFSARDLDLKMSGPRSVRPEVVTLSDVCERHSILFGTPNNLDAFSAVLQGDGDRRKPGTLFIFDNFETMQDLTDLHRFLDQHTTSPNKVLLTTRERAFKADYPVEVKGMEREEASSMLHALAAQLNISPILTEQTFASVYEQTKGHPYVMRVMIGEMAKEKRYIAPSQILSSRVDVPHAVFERSFSRLTDSGRAIFLSVSNWRSLISELSLLVVLGLRGIDVEAGVDECVRLSLIYFEEHSDGQRLYYAPELARTFGKKKLEGDPDKLVIQSDLETIRKFGVITDVTRHGAQPVLVAKFLAWCHEEAKQNKGERNQEIDRLIENLASLWPGAWLELGRFRRKLGFPPDLVEAALRRAVEETPDSIEAWLERADHARAYGNEGVRIASLVSAVEAAPHQIDLVKETAFQLAKYIKEQEIPPARRSVYLSSVRSHMQKLENDLDAVGLSRLAWLFIMEGDTARGREYASMGLRKDPTNSYCQKIMDNQEL